MALGNIKMRRGQTKAGRKNEAMLSETKENTTDGKKMAPTGPVVANDKQQKE